MRTSELGTDYVSVDPPSAPLELPCRSSASTQDHSDLGRVFEVLLYSTCIEEQCGYSHEPKSYPLPLPLTKIPVES